MAKFDLITNPSKDHIDQAWDFSDSYFTIDTAERALVDTWYHKNAENMIYALCDNKVVGFFNVIPLTEECGKLFESNDIKEEEIGAEHILACDVTKYAQYLYVAAIAVKDRHSIKSHQCVAALMGGLCNRITTLYDLAYLKKMFANPTTFDGNRLIKKLGLEPIQSVKRSIRAGNDIYTLTFNQSAFDNLNNIENRYQRFINALSWERN